jgi:hypothetical protein
MGERKGAYRVLLGKSLRKRPLGKTRRRWEDDIKMDIEEEGWDTCTAYIWVRIETDGGLL